ncbi:transporter [Sphingomonas sp. CL5.1]|uniref:transporter n=1 Tax=Sphingomonas sp. CL5.1 TaxID=2653203 RepID=UPI001583725A|nr:transporter [Sphingomonas sp. CL5.1]QKR99265.1 transporter [Sphingomonas sp. CL5.1]
MKTSREIRCCVLMAVGSVAALPTTAAYAQDAQPGDFVTAPAGTQLGLVYYLGSTSDNFVDAKGNDVPASSLDTNVLLLRYVYYFDVAGVRADVNVLQPFGGLHNMRLGGRKIGTKEFTPGDLTLVGTVWPLNDPKKGRYFGIATYLTLPTGDYSATRPGLAANRWSVAIQPGFRFKIAPKWSVDLVGGTTIYGDNHDGAGATTIRKDASYTALGWLNYQASDKTTLSFGGITNRGGAETIGGVKGADVTSTTVRADWSQMLNPTTQFLIEVGHDVEAKNNFKRDATLTLRLAKFF